jgi:uncharacterized protein (DUF2267 family)
MQTEEFIHDVQATLLDAESNTATVAAIKATLIALCFYLQPQHVEQLANLLPPEIGNDLLPARIKMPVSLYDFFHSVADREATTLPLAIHHARTVLVALETHLPPSLVMSIRHQLPGEFALLFQVGSFLNKYHKEVNNVE